MKSILMQEGDHKFTLEVFDDNGVWLMGIKHTPEADFTSDLERQASQWKKTDPDIYEAIRKEVAKAYFTLHKHYE